MARVSHPHDSVNTIEFTPATQRAVQPGVVRRTMIAWNLLVMAAAWGCAERVQDDASTGEPKGSDATQLAVRNDLTSDGNGFPPSSSNSSPTKQADSPPSKNTQTPRPTQPSPQGSSPQNTTTSGPSTPVNTTSQDADGIDAFARLELAKQYLPQQAQAAQLAQAGKIQQAKQVLERIVSEAPFLPNARYNYACLLALNNEREQALEQLAAAVENGFTDVPLIEQDNDLVSLHQDSQFKTILERARQIRASDDRVSVEAPAVVKNQIAAIGPQQATFDARYNMVRTVIDWSQKPEFQGELPCVWDGEVGQLLREWYAAGTAAGNWGDLYDNCDRNHSRLKHDKFPTLTRLTYDKSIRKSIPYGLQTVLWHNGVVVGNSSTALTGSPLWRSNTRYGYVSASSVQRLHNQYRTNHVYVYPDHTDYGLQHGDVFPANTPYVFTSRGSSGSDQPFLNGIVCALAAFRPEVKQKLIDENLIAPTLQWLVRHSLEGVVDESDYLTGRVHEPVLNGKSIDRLRLVNLAHDMQLDSIPPLVKLRVEEEDQGEVGKDFFDIADRTKLFDSPQSIARIYRTVEPTTRIVLSAEESEDVNGYPLRFEWVVLNADPETVEIKKLNANGSRAEITIPYTPKRRIREDEKRQTSRLDIGVFAHNGKTYSSPAYLTYFTLANEERKYDAGGQLFYITYRGGPKANEESANAKQGKGGKGNTPYVDPMIDAPKSWRDDYHYTRDRKLIGWTRTRGTITEEYTRDGLLVKEKDAQGRPTKAVVVRYFSIPGETSPMVYLDYEPTSELKTYRYSGPNDQLGSLD